MRMTQSRYMCDENKSETECREEFISDHPQFEYIYVPGDGNCLFHTLAEFYRRSGKTIPGVANPTNHEELRRYIVQQFNNIMQEQPESVLELLIDQDYIFRVQEQERYKKIIEDHILYLQQEKENVTNAVIQLSSLQPIMPRNIQTIIVELGQPRSWYNAAFDLMVDCIPAILNVNLSMYTAQPPTENRRYIIIDNVVTTPNGGPSVDTTIYVLLSGNHYGLLYPKDSSASLQSMIRRNKEVLEQRNARMAASMAGVPYSQPPRPSQHNANLEAAMAASRHTSKLEELARQQSSAMLAAMPAAMLPSERQELERQLQSRPMTNMERAIAASLDTKASNNAIRQQKQVASAAVISHNNYNNAEEKYPESNINYNSNASSVVSNASSVRSIENFTNDDMKQTFPIENLSIENIRKELKHYGVPFNYSNSKKVLYQKLVDPFKKNMNIRTKRTMEINKYAKKVKTRKEARNARRAAKGAARNTKKANKKSNKK